MPLKHAHETRLIVLLAIAIALAGVACAILPPLPQGMLLWVGAFAVSLLYPVMLSPTLRRNRADNTFRKLHWFPALMLLVWFILQGGAMLFTELAFLAGLYTWGWTIGLVTFGFFLLVVFCLQVIRQRGIRMFLLALLFIPFAAGAFLAEQQGIDLAARVTAFVDEYRDDALALLPSWGSGSGSTSSAASSQDMIADNGMNSSLPEETNLDPSEDPAEERWRESLRAFKERMDRLMQGNVVTDGTGSIVGDESSSLSQEDVSSSPNQVASISDTETTPTHLPESGFGLGAIVVSLLGGYSATLHRRAKKRFFA